MLFPYQVLKKLINTEVGTTSQSKIQILDFWRALKFTICCSTGLPVPCMRHAAWTVFWLRRKKNKNPDPDTKVGQHDGYFSREWDEDCKWLEYSIVKNCIFCFACSQFQTKQKQNNKTIVWAPPCIGVASVEKKSRFCACLSLLWLMFCLCWYLLPSLQMLFLCWCDFLLLLLSVLSVIVFRMPLWWINVDMCLLCLPNVQKTWQCVL